MGRVRVLQRRSTGTTQRMLEIGLEHLLSLNGQVMLPMESTIVDSLATPNMRDPPFGFALTVRLIVLEV